MIAVLGSINLDFVASSPRLPSAGETIAGISFVVSPGASVQTNAWLFGDGLRGHNERGCG